MGHQSQSVRTVWKCHQLMPLLGIEPQFFRRPSRSLVRIPAELSRLPTLADCKGYLNYPKFALRSCSVTDEESELTCCIYDRSDCTGRIIFIRTRTMSIRPHLVPVGVLQSKIKILVC